MNQIAFHDLKPGMVVAKDIYGKTHNLILGKETILNQEMITQLSQSGIQQIWIERKECEENLDEQTIKQSKHEITETLNAKFQSVSHNPLMMELKNICINYLIRKRVS